MINCPNCNHQNPDGALQCEACYTPLPSLANCPHCNATIQADASFCGQCGSDLREESLSPSSSSSPSSPSASAVEVSSSPTQPDPSVPISAATSADLESSTAVPKTQNFLDPDESSDPPDTDIPDLITPDPLVTPPPLGNEGPSSGESGPTYAEISTQAEPEAEPEVEPEVEPEIEPEIEPVPIPAVTPIPAKPPAATQIQTFSARLRQVQTGTAIEIPRGLSVVRIGKPNDHTPPDIDVSGFPDSEVVSRAHANIRVEGDTYYLEDVGSSNGTYINGLPLPVGNRHRLRPGDRIALGKGDKVSFVFEMAN